MASQQNSAGSCPPAHVVGNAFVRQFYSVLHDNPQLAYRFYQDSSKLGRPEADGAMSSVTTMQAINEKIVSLNSHESRAEIETVDSQDSFNGGVIVLVTGYLTGKDNVRRSFTQSFFLAPQEKGYFVLNDIFRYVDEVNDHQEEMQQMDNGPHIAHDNFQNQENSLTDNHVALSEEEVNVEEVYNPSENESIVEEEPSAPEVVDEVPNDSQPVADLSSAVQEEAPKKSYASIVKVMKESPPFAVAVKSVPANVERQIPSSISSNQVPEFSATNSNNAESASSQEHEGDGCSIYIRSLPMNATPSQLEEVFKAFGSIRTNGIQVRSNKQGFCFGFVQFVEASSVHSAIAASPIIIGGRQAYVEEKRSTATGPRVNRGRFLPARGAFRNDMGRGMRGTFGMSRGYGGRGDYNGRNDYGNARGTGRGGGRGMDGGYGRMNRPIPVNVASRNVAPRVSASA